MRQAPSLKKFRDFGQSSIKTKKVTNSVCFLNIPGKKPNILTFLMESWCIVFHWESFFLSGKFSLKTVSEPSFYRDTHEISVRAEISSTNTLYILNIYKQPTE